MTDTALDPTQFREGMTVLSTDGERVGRIKAVQSGTIVVERVARPDIHVPFAFIRYAAGNDLVLTVSANKVAEMHWETPAR